MRKPAIRMLGVAAAAAMLVAACADTGSVETTISLPPIVTGEPSECAAGDGLDALLVPRCGALLGTTDSSMVGEVPLDLSHQEATVTTLDRANGGDGEQFSFDLVRVYQRGSEGAVDTLREEQTRLDSDDSRLLYLSWKVTTGSGAWERVAAGEHDEDLRAVASAIADGGHTIFLSFHHEPEGDIEGFPEDYVAMWQHGHQVVEETLAASEGSGDVVWVMNYQGHVTGERFDEVDDYFPGTAFVDWLSYNPYNWAVCRQGAAWRSFLDVASPMYQYLTTQPQFANPDGSLKPIMIGETASNEDPDQSSRKADWLRDLASVLEKGKLPQIKAVVYFNLSSPTFCDRYWDSSMESAEAFAELATSPFFNPQTPAPGDE